MQDLVAPFLGTLALVALGVVLYFGSLVALGFRPRHFKRSEMQ